MSCSAKTSGQFWTRRRPRHRCTRKVLRCRLPTKESKMIGVSFLVRHTPMVRSGGPGGAVLHRAVWPLSIWMRRARAAQMACSSLEHQGQACCCARGGACLGSCRGQSAGGWLIWTCGLTARLWSVDSRTSGPLPTITRTIMPVCGGRSGWQSKKTGAP